MVDGVVRVWSDAGSMQAGGMSTELFPLPGSAADFFTDMHRVLRYASLGPVKSFCHHRCAGMRLQDCAVFSAAVGIVSPDAQHLGIPVVVQRCASVQQLCGAELFLCVVVAFLM
jgi:hypothetical protein